MNRNTIIVTITLVCTLWITASAWILNRNVKAFAEELGIHTGQFIERIDKDE